MESRKTPLPFVFGRAFHRAVEVFYSARGSKYEFDMAKVVRQEFAEVDRGILTPDEIMDLDSQMNMVLGICEVYPIVYKDDFKEFQDFILEEHFEIVFGTMHGYQLSYQGYIDGLFQDASGAWWIFETKTKKYGKPGSIENATYIKKVHIDNQVLGYIHGGEQILTKRFGKPTKPVGVIYNVIQKPAIRKKKTETLSDFRARIREEYTVHAQAKEYFARYPLQLKQNLIDNWKDETRQRIMELADRKHRSYTKKDKQILWPMNSQACTNKWGTCKWLPACTAGKYNQLLYKKKEKRRSEKK